MLKRRILKCLQGPAGGGLWPLIQNLGFNLLSDLLMSWNKSFSVRLPVLNAAANNGDFNAMYLKANDSYLKGQLNILQSSQLKSPYNGETITPPTTAASGDEEKEDDDKTPFFETKAGKRLMVGALIGLMLGDALINSGFTNYKLNGNTDMRKNLSSAGRTAISTFMPGWGTVIAAGDSLIEGLGGKTDTSEGLGAVNDIGNMAASIALPGAGWWAPKTKKYSLSDMIKTSASYRNVAEHGEKVARNAGARLLFGANKQNQLTDKLFIEDRNTEKILSDSKDAFGASNYYGVSLRNLIELQGGIKTVHVKKGGKLNNLMYARNMLNNIAEEVPIIEEFKEGGKTRSLEELIKYAKELNPRFILRMSEPIRYVEFTELGDDGKEYTKLGTHKLGFVEYDGLTYVYPQIQEDEQGNLKYYKDLKEASDRAMKNKDVLPMSLDEANIFTKEYKSGWPDFFLKFKEGGKFNVIPAGSLHAHRHHMEDVSDEFKDLTTKGIPVVTEGEGGELILQAEIEKDEVIFHITLTKKLEELAEDGSDEAAIEAGKLLAKELMENTIDNTGLMEEIL